MLKAALWDMSPKTVKGAACQEIVLEGDDVDLNQIPLHRCWPGDVAPLLTWGLVITRGPNAKRQNMGIYCQQLIGTTIHSGSAAWRKSGERYVEVLGAARTATKK